MDNQYEDDTTDGPKPTTSEIFSQLQKLYTDQLEKIDGSNEGLKVKVEVLESWVKDLTDHNVMLIKTVDELEDEALKRLGMLEENLIPKDLPQETEKAQELSADKRVAYLCNDIWNLLELLRRLREEGFWYLDDLRFKTITYEQIFGVPQDNLSLARSLIQISTSQPSKVTRKTKSLDQIDLLCQELEEVKLQLFEKDKLVCKYKQKLEELRNAVKEEKLNSCNETYRHPCSMTENELNANTRTFELQTPAVLHRELESTQQQLCQMEKEVSLSKKKLKEAEANIKRLRCDLVNSEKMAKEMRAALSAEVAEKHDQVLALRKEVVQLEDQLRQADMQTHFKDDIIKELRKEVKVARSKETLVEVLGIKERSLSHLEHLTQQLEQKEITISCLKAQLKQKSDTLYPVRQQIDWFSENISQLCASNNIPEEFKKCITTMVDELRESVECCNIGPSNNTEQHKDLKESIEFLSAILDSLDISQKNLCESWTSIWDTSHQLNKIEPAVHIENWKNCLYKQCGLQQKILHLVHSIIQKLSNTQAQTGSIIDEIGSLFCLISSVQDELNIQPQSNCYAVWLKRLHRLVSQSIVKMQEISKLSADLRNKEEKVLVELDENMNSLSVLGEELGDTIRCEQQVYGNLNKLEKLQKVKLDTLLANVLHHNDIWQQQVASDADVKKEIRNLIHSYKNVNCKPTSGKSMKQPKTRSSSLQVRTLVSQISSEIQSSISDIEQRQNQVNHLEVDLSSVRIFLESAQQEIQHISKNCRSKDISEKVTCLLTKLSKEVTNALKKAENLVDAYKISKQDFVASSKRVDKLKKEFDLLEKELVQYYTYIYENCNEPLRSPRCDKKICPAQAELKDYKTKCADQRSSLQPCCDSFSKYKEMQSTVAEKDKTMKNVTEKMTELKSNLQEREKLVANQEETICVLQSSLKMCQKEAEEFQKIIASLEVKKCEIEKECNKQVQQLQNKISDMKCSMKQSEDIIVYQEKEAMRNVQNVNLELATLAGSLREDSRRAQTKLSEAYKERAEMEKKHQKSEAALQIVINNLKETMNKDQSRLCEVQQENVTLQERLAKADKAQKVELELLTVKDSTAIQENEQTIAELKKQAKTCSAKVAEMETKLKTVQEQLREVTCRERELQHQLSFKESQHEEALCDKQLEITKLSNVIRTMTDKLKSALSELESERTKHCETEQKLRSVCAACDDLKIKLRESESTSEKLQAALTQLSNKFVSSRLDKGGLRHYQEQCAKFESLYNATCCRLLSKEAELDSVMKEMERLRASLNCRSMEFTQHRDEEEECPFLLGRVQQLSKELQLARSCHTNYESLLKELTEKYSKKEDEVANLKMQLKQVTMQRDSLLMDLQVTQEQLAKLKVDNSELERTLQKVEVSKEQITEQMKNVQRMLCDSQVSGGSLALRMQPNIELQREISTTLSSQLRSTKQKLHNVRQDYKLLQTAYEELNGKYGLLQRGERESEHNWDVTHRNCTPCGVKSSKSVAHVKYSQEYLKDKAHKYSSHSKSWHKLETGPEVEEKEKLWKQKLQQVIRGEDLDEFSSS